MARMTDAKRREINNDRDYKYGWSSQSTNCHQVFKDLSFGKITREQAATRLREIADKLLTKHDDYNQLALGINDAP